MKRPRSSAPSLARVLLLATAAAILAMPFPGDAAGGSHREERGAPAPAFVPRDTCLFRGREDTSLPPANADFQVIVAGPGNVGLTISNFGTIGNDHDTRAASFEFPNGSEIEHLIRGGLWIGAVSADGETLVSSGTIVQNISTPGEGSTEFVPLTRIQSRSTLQNRPDFSPDALSEQDLIASFRDFPARDVSSGEEPCPLGVEVQLTSLGWSFKPVDDFLILNYTIKNVSTVALTSLYFGMFAEFATNFKGKYPEWPPPSVTVLFEHKVISWDDTLRLFTEHHCDFDGGQAPTFGGMKILGTRPDSIAGKTVSFNWFDFALNDETLDDDGERFALLSNGDSDSTDSVTNACIGGQTINDPVEVASVGPYSILLPGDTLSVAFAVIGGDDYDDLVLNAAWAQRAFDSNYIIPQPPPSPRMAVDPGPNEVTVYWDASPEAIPDPASGLIDFEGYRIYVSADDASFTRVRDLDLVDSIGFNTGFADVRHDTTISGVDYDYRLTIPSLRNGFRYSVSVTSYDVGDPTQGLPPLESGIPQNKSRIIPGSDAVPTGGRTNRITVYPNPYRGQAAWDGSLPRERLIWFNHLPERCVIRIFTLSGDLVEEIPFNGSTYHAEGNFLLDRPDEDPPVLSGGQAAWDLITKENQPAASGLYFFAVEDLATGETETGKFLILK